MTPEQMRIALAEWAGWEKFNDKGLWRLGPKYDVHVVATTPDSEIAKARRNMNIGPLPNLPNYPEDLNAVHELEEQLADGQWETYAGYLAQFHQPLNTFKFLHATAAQRCEALCRTLGLWKEASDEQAR